MKVPDSPPFNNIYLFTEEIIKLWAQNLKNYDVKKKKNTNEEEEIEKGEVVVI